MRIRALKPGSFLNEQLCSLSSFHRLLYAGLWLCADRQGRLQDRPKRLKAEIFPYDDADVDEFFSAASKVDLDFHVTFHEKLVVVPRAGDSGAIELKVTPK